MLKFFLIILLICAPIIAAEEQLPFVFSPNPNCEIITVKKNPQKCENGKYLSWLVRMYILLAEVPKGFDIFPGRHDCLFSPTCVIITQSSYVTWHYPDYHSNSFVVDSINRDTLQLACCDKTEPPEPVPDIIIPNNYDTNKKYNCIISERRNNCSHFHVWLDNKEIASVGREMDRQIVQTIQECFALCRNNYICVGFFFSSHEKNCTTKYSRAFERKKNSTDEDDIVYEWNVELHCCKDPVPMNGNYQSNAVTFHVDIKFIKENIFQCPIGWVKRWITDDKIICDTSRGGLMEKLDECTMEVGMDACWEKNCLFLVVNERKKECFLYKYFLYCLMNDKDNDHRVAFMACEKNIEKEIRLPEVKSVFTDCIFNRPDLIGYNGTISKSMQNNLCLNWHSSSFKANHFPNNNNNHNYCRNINNDPKGPWCITSGHHHMEYCSIPKCEALIEEKSNITSKNCQKLTNPRQCNATDWQGVVVRETNQTVCPNELLATETVSMAEYCFYACAYHPHCLFAFFNRVNNSCQLAKTVVECENQTQLDFVEIVCCLKEKDTDDKLPNVDCQFISTWFIVLLSISYFLLMVVGIFWLVLLLKYKEIISICEFDEIVDKIENIFPRLRRSFSESSLSTTDKELSERNGFSKKPKKISYRAHSALSSGSFE